MLNKVGLDFRVQCGLWIMLDVEGIERFINMKINFKNHWTFESKQRPIKNTKINILIKCS